MITTDSLFEIHHIYEHTTIILGIECLIMGATLLTLAVGFKQGRSHSKQGLIFLAAAMFVLCIINCAENILGDGNNINDVLAITVFAASIEMFLLFFAYMSMLCREFVNRRRIYIEVGLIALFTAPALFVSQENEPALFNVLFLLGVGFYAIKLIFNVVAYRKQLRITTEEIKSYHSRESSSLLGWINTTFSMVLAIGVVSVVVPMTNLPVLTIYNALLFFAYFYIYISVIRNIDIFDRSMEAVECNESESPQPESPQPESPQPESPQPESPQPESPQPETCPKKIDSFIALHQKFLDNWIEGKGFCVSGITIGEVATQLHTNRTKLSRYLKEELQTNYYEWIACLRMEEAKRQLIEHPDKSVINIAHDVGIEDRYNFGRVFQRFVGVSPTVYRKEYSKENPQ